MARSFIKIVDKNTNIPYYLVWSSIVDAPITYGTTREGLTAWIKDEYGTQGLKTVDFERLEEKGTTSPFYQSAEDSISDNRAGENESNISIEEIIQRYCLLFPA